MLVYFRRHEIFKKGMVNNELARKQKKKMNHLKGGKHEH